MTLPSGIAREPNSPVVDYIEILVDEIERRRKVKITDLLADLAFEIDDDVDIKELIAMVAQELEDRGYNVYVEEDRIILQ